MKRLSTLLIILLCSISAWAQQTERERPCGTVEEWQRQVQQDPETQRRHDALEEWTRNFVNNANNPGSRGGQDDDSVLVIPVVFHVMHNFGAENISYAQIEDGVRIMNEYYSFGNPDTGQISATFRPLAANIRFEFRLARIDPNGNCTIGVTRTQTDLTDEGDNRLKSLIRWPSNRYLNIWVCNSIASGAAAYANYPGSNPSVDGIVASDSYVGQIGTAANNTYGRRTLAHEAGHWFNLMHTWGNSNESGLPSNCGIDDGVADTPNTIGSTDQGGCDLNRHTCGEAMPDNVENMMDYSGCRRMFTMGQKARMRAAAYSSTGGRNNLWSQNNLVAAGVETRGSIPVCAPTLSLPPIAYRICPGVDVRYQATISNAPEAAVSYRWELPGSSQPTSTDMSPEVTYATPGIYSVRLRIANAAGADSAAVENSIVVRNPNAIYAPGDSETFAGNSFPIVSDTASHFWEIESSDGNIGWERNLTAGFGDSASLQSNLRNLASDNVYSALTPAFDLTNVVRPAYLVFRYSSAKSIPIPADELSVYASFNCGQAWNVLSRRNAGTSPNLYTQPSAVAGSYTPQPSHFVEAKLSVHNYVGRPSVRFKFEMAVGGGGNAFFLDNVKVIGAPVGVDERFLLQDVEIAPNPSSTLVEVNLPSWPETKPVRYELISPLGQRVKAGRSDGNRFTMDVSALSAGVYMLQLEGQKMQRLIVD